MQALADVSLAAAHGEIVAVVGPSGCGKTTLLELICRLQRPRAGSLECPSAALMPQRDLLLPWLTRSTTPRSRCVSPGARARQARERAADAVRRVRAGRLPDRRPAELSGGMRQRVAFLRTLLSGKPLLCLDEPFGALDAITRAEMQEWLAQAIRREPRTVVLVTHDVEEAVVLADRALVLSPRPGRVSSELEIELPRPRRAATRRSCACASTCSRCSAPPRQSGRTRERRRAASARTEPAHWATCSRQSRCWLALIGAWEAYVDAELAERTCPPRTRSLKPCGTTPACSATQPANHRRGGRRAGLAARARGRLSCLRS